jgi:hypothetical protein
LEPFPCDTACVLSFLALKLNLQLPAQFVSIARHHMLKAGLKDILPSQRDVNGLELGPSPQSFQLVLEQCVFIVKREKMRCGCCDFDDWQFKCTASACTFSHFAPNIAIDVQLEVGMRNGLSPQH